MAPIKCFSPAHITGFFCTHFDSSDILKSGSSGAGFSINRGVITEVDFRSTDQSFNKIFINNQLSSARVSEKTIEIFKLVYDISPDLFYRVAHSIEVPMGCGFGTSGAGALSLSLGLHKLHGLDVSLEKVAQIAHMAEVQLKTGLGTVTAETYGGMEIRLTPGAPGIASLDFIEASDFSAAFCVWGPVDTSEVLGNDSIRANINASGHRMVRQLVQDPGVYQLMELSYIFTHKVNLVSEQAKNLMAELKNHELFSGMLMFGDGIFVVYKKNQEKLIKTLFEKHENEANIIYSRIEEKGVRIVDKDSST